MPHSPQSNCCHAPNMNDSWTERFDKNVENHTFFNQTLLGTRTVATINFELIKKFIKSELETATAAAIERTVREIHKELKGNQDGGQFIVENYAQSKGISLTE